MVSIEVRSSQKGVPSVWVNVDHVTDEEVKLFRQKLSGRLKLQDPSDAVADAFVDLTQHCPQANPSDLWQHVIYRHLITEEEWNDNKWKRVSGYALERALVQLYQPRLAPLGVRMHIVSAAEATRRLAAMGVSGIKPSKIDLWLEGLVEKEDGLFGTIKEWTPFGCAHVKASIAERIQDDVPASMAFMTRGYTSVAVTLDSKSYPPPHGTGVNYGELGGRSTGIDKDRLKRNYVEVDGQFDGLFSFNTRTPESPGQTPSGKRIVMLSMHDKQPDKLIEFLTDQWQEFAQNKGIKAVQS